MGDKPADTCGGERDVSTGSTVLVPGVDTATSVISFSEMFGNAVEGEGLLISGASSDPVCCSITCSGAGEGACANKRERELAARGGACGELLLRTRDRPGNKWGAGERNVSSTSASGGPGGGGGITDVGLELSFTFPGLDWNNSRTDGPDGGDTSCPLPAVKVSPAPVFFPDERRLFVCEG